MTVPRTKPAPVGTAKRNASRALPGAVRPGLAPSSEVSPRMKIFGFMDAKITIVGDFDETPEEIVDLMTNGPI